MRRRKHQLKVAYEEATSLWHDYAIALHGVHDIIFTERCTNLSHRIITMGKAFGPVHWVDVPLSIVVTHYEATYGRGNVDFPVIDWKRVNEVRRAINENDIYVLFDKPNTITDYELIMNKPVKFIGTDVIQLEGIYDDFNDVHNDLGTTGRHHIA